MLVFIDESGDPGFKLDRGSSPVFVAAMVIFQDREAAQTTEQVIGKTKAALKVAREFKFNSSSTKVREAFFRAVAGCPFRVRAIVVDKAAIRSTNLKSNKERFYGFFVRLMMAHDGGQLRQADVRIDGSGDRAFKREFRSYLRRQLGADALKSCSFSDSHRDLLIQLADMVAGAIARSYRTDRPARETWRKMLAGKLDDVWEFR
jgi:hypothetical protein